MVTLEEARAHLRLSIQVGDSLLELEEDAEVAQMIEAAKSHLESINVNLSAVPLPPALHHAILLLVGHFFEHREATNSEQLRFTPIGVDRLIAPFKEVSL